MSAEQEHVPDVLLERYRLKELPPDEAARLDDRIRRDETLRQRLEALDRSDEEIRRRYPPDALAARIRQRIEANDGAPARATRRRIAYWAVPLAVAAAVTLLVVVVPRTADSPGAAPISAPTTGTDSERIKGLSPTLALYRRTAQGSETLADGAVARAGDLLRVGYRAAGKQYGVILSIDGRGEVTVHLPPQADRAAPLKRDGAMGAMDVVLLDQAYELDDAPQWERFYFVTGDTSFAVAPIVDAARAAAAAHRSPPAALALPPGLEQCTFSVQKEAR